MFTVLLIEDDPSVREMLRTFLTGNDYGVVEAKNADEAFHRLAERNPDLILLDWMLPGMSGPELLREIRANPAHREVPVIMLTARADEADKIRGLETGADDYITKPFSMQELSARMKALLRRSHRLNADQRIEVGALTLDPLNHELHIDGMPVSMSRSEFRLLHYLMRTAGRLHSRAHLLDQVWGQGSFIEERTVDVHILRLRKLLKQHGVTDLIETVRGAGYRLQKPADG